METRLDESPSRDPSTPRLRLAKTVDSIAAAIGQCLDLRSLNSEIVSKVKDLLGADGVTVFLADREGGLSCDTVDGGADESVFGVHLSPGEGVAGWCARERRPVVIPEAATDARFTTKVDGRTGYRTRTLAAVPLVIAGDLVGVLEVVNRLDGSPFDREDLDVLTALAPHVAVAMNNARLTESLRRRAQDLETELERRVGQILHAKREWEATIDAFADPILLIDPDRRVRRANRATAERAGLPIVAVPGRLCHEVAFGASEPCEGCPLPAALEGLPASAELQIENQVHHASLFPVGREETGVFAVACSYRDVTATRAMEHRLRNSERMASVGRLAAGIAHEINNPIAFMTSNLHALHSYFEDLVEASKRAISTPKHEVGSGDPSPTTRGKIAIGAELAEIEEDGKTLLLECEAGAHRIARIVKQLGSFAHDRRSTEEVFPLGHCVKRARRLLETEFPGVIIDVRDEAEGKVRGCPASFDRAISAMMRNAVQASLEHVIVEIRDEPGVIELAVEDRGAGIDEAIRSRVFEPFFTTRDVGCGMGLGLSVVYTAVHQHRGSVAIEDVAGGGTRIVIRVPRFDG